VTRRPNQTTQAIVPNETAIDRKPRGVSVSPVRSPASDILVGSAVPMGVARWLTARRSDHIYVCVVCGIVSSASPDLKNMSVGLRAIL
jgi:hypothetical protein